MRIIKKETLDNLINVTRKYWNTGDVDFLPAKTKYAGQLSIEAFGNDNKWCSFMDMVGGIIRLNKKITDDSIYAIHTLAGFAISGPDIKE